MKKILAFTFAAALTTTMISCGPSADEQKKDSLEVDSTKRGMADEAQHMIDSINRVDSINNANMKRTADSIKMADSMANLKNKKK
jgi:hypothetical protein